MIIKPITHIILFAGITAALGGCALQAVKPADVEAHIDPISVTSPAKLDQDVATCTAFADQSVKKARKHALLGILVGALAGAAAGSAIGHGTGLQRNFAAAGAIEGMAVGATPATVAGGNRTERIIYNCLVHRGYQLLY